MNRIKKITLSLVVLLTIVGLVGGMLIPTPASAASVQPQLIEFAVQMPDKVISVIAQKTDTTQRAEKLVVELGGTVTKDLHIINAFAAEMPAGEVPELAASGTVRWVSLDGVLDQAAKPPPKTKDTIEEPAEDPSPVLPQNLYLDTLNVKPVWDMGYQGQGVTVAVIDSGINNESDFRKRILINKNFNPDSLASTDGFGHGTHVAGIIGGDGNASDGLYQGIAPQVGFINLKISNNDGMAYESDMVAAIQWAYDHKDSHNIRIVNLSVNSTVNSSYHTSPVDAAVEILWFNGIVVVASAGNKSDNGNEPVFAAPANDPFIITVGATNEKGTAVKNDDTVASFTSWGTTQDGHKKPDIFAPGKDIVSVLSNNTSWTAEYPDRIINIGNKAEYFRLSGTSMAAPMVSGAVALLLQAEPDLTPDQVKYRLLHSSSSVSGWNYLDVYTALTTPTTESANTDIQASQLLWSGDEPVVWSSVAWNSVAWNSVAWNSVAWNSVAWND